MNLQKNILCAACGEEWISKGFTLYHLRTQKGTEYERLQQ